MKKSTDYKYPNRIVRYLQRAGLCNRRNLFWSFYEPRNFGDWIGPYLFEAYTGQTPLHYAPKLGGWSTAVYAAGSILRNIERPDVAIVWGSGIIDSNERFPRPKEVHAVRGPRSSTRLAELGYQTTDVYGDPAILMPLVFSPDVEKQHRVGLIPHFEDYQVMHAAYQDVADVKIIDVRLDVESVIEQILSCDMTLSSSLHGIILSHSYGVPCAWINSWQGLMGNGVKFHDYYEAANIFDVRPFDLRSDATAADLEAVVKDSDMADVSVLQGPLKAACPFGA